VLFVIDTLEGIAVTVAVLRDDDVVVIMGVMRTEELGAELST
jgi:hypothetical protein